MTLLKNKLYREDLAYVSELNLPWEKLKKKSILLSGATGMIGSFLIDVIMYKNLNEGLCCHIYAVGRAMDCIQCNHVNYVLHLASNTHPMAYSTDPIGTITTNIMGVYNMLEFADRVHAERMAFVSSNEIYGENRGDVEKFDEKYLGYIDCNTMRAGYPESKRCGEALCQAYIAQKGLDVVIPRLTRSYGPTLLDSDTKALSQFLKKGLAHEDIVLKSAGTQYYSYTYVADAVAGLFIVLLCGEKGEAYNISDKASDIMLKDLAAIIAKASGTKVVFDVPDAVEAAGYSTATKARLDNRKITELGFKARYDIETGISRTLKIMEE